MSLELEDLLRPLAPQVLGALVRRYGQFDACEDAVQEALLAASVQWRDEGVPDSPKAWLITVATRKLTDQWRSEQARRRRETLAATREPSTAAEPSDRDDTLQMLVLCCHPDLSPSSQVALTLRAVGGLTTGQIARAFLVPEATMGQRISRAKQKIKATGIPRPEWAGRRQVVLHVLYLIFNEGYTASSGPDLHSVELTGEAIRLARTVHAVLPDDGEVAGLLALMLLTDARRAARTTKDGGLVPLAEQDRTLWDAGEIAEGTRLVDDAMARFPIGPYQLQAAIAALHAAARAPRDTDWPQILVLYQILSRMRPNPMVTLNHAIALSMVDGPAAGLAMLATLDDDSRVAGHHRLEAVRAHLLERDGDLGAARAAYLRAAKRTSSIPERRYLEAMADKLGP